MKYRIKIITYKNGRKEYIAQFKTKIGWSDLDSDGRVLYLGSCYPQEKREWSLERIDKHFYGNTKKQSIEFEYINK